MDSRTLTKVVVLAVPAVVGVYDLFVFLACGSDATISRVVLGWLGPVSVQAVVALFALGVVVGHLVVPQHPDPSTDSEPGRDELRRKGWWR